MSVSVASGEPLAAFFSGRIRSLHDLGHRAITSEQIHSPWLRGYFRELPLRELLEPLIPHTCRLVTGTVVDSYDHSRERARSIKSKWYCCDLSAAQRHEFPEVLSLIALLLQELPELRELRRRKARSSRYIRCLRDKKLVPRRP
ncbi:MAG TPA: hypothetical protein VJ860_13225 [Polyangia bacterium]|jgi:hypothetical protein|nr:hypothetical protein [Polyangia bacterium]